MTRPTRRYGESNEDWGKRIDRWEKRSKAYVRTPARERAMAIGSAIRTIACIDSMMHNKGQGLDLFRRDDFHKVRDILDAAMHRLGYESLSEHKVRTRDMLTRGEYTRSKDFKYKKLETSK